MKYWEIIADNLTKAGWSWGCVSGVDSSGRIFVADAQRGDGKRFVVRADEKLTAFIELEWAIRGAGNHGQLIESNDSATVPIPLLDRAKVRIFAGRLLLTKR